MTGTLATTAGFTAAAVEVGRDEGARDARDELNDRIYEDAEPTLIERVQQWFDDWLEWLGRQVGDILPGGWLVLGLLLALLLALLVGLLGYARPNRRSRRHRTLFVADTALTAEDHRGAADEHAASGAYTEAIRERLRAVSRDLEERAIITPRPGRTATELAAEASGTLPAHSDALHRGAALFNDVAYGDRPATADDEHMLRELDDRLRQTRPVGDGESGQ